MLELALLGRNLSPVARDAGPAGMGAPSPGGPADALVPIAGEPSGLLTGKAGLLNFMTPGVPLAAGG